MKFTRFVFLALGLAMIGLFLYQNGQTPDSKAAFGTSPPWIRNDHLLPGTTLEQTINLSRNNPVQDMKVSVRLDGDKKFLKWIKIEDQDDLVMKKGQKVLPMNVTIKVPKRAALKDYRGGIFVTLTNLKSDTSQAGAVSIKLGAHILIELSVIGDKVTDYRVKSISLSPINEGDPFSINVDVENLGNTEITDLTGQVDIYDSKETEILKSLTFGTLVEPVSPDELSRNKVIFEDVILDPGEYWVRVKAIKNGEIIYENRLFQQIIAKVVPVITPEDAEAGKPSLPAIPGQEADLAPGEGQADLAPGSAATSDLRPAAAIQQTVEASKLLIVFGVVGFGFGLLALLAVIVLLVVLIKRQRQATIQHYLSYHNAHRE